MFRHTLNWTHASDRCEKFGSQLVVVDSVEENSFLKAITTTAGEISHIHSNETSLKKPVIPMYKVSFIFHASVHIKVSHLSKPITRYYLGTLVINMFNNKQPTCKHSIHDAWQA